MALRSLPRERRGRAICDDTGRDRSRRLSFDPNALQSELGRVPRKNSPVASTMPLGGQRPSAEWEEWAESDNWRNGRNGWNSGQYWTIGQSGPSPPLLRIRHPRLKPHSIVNSRRSRAFSCGILDDT